MSISWLTAFLDTPEAGFDTRLEFWAAITGWSVSPFRGEESEFATLLPPQGDPVLRVQRLADGMPGIHLDLHVDSIPVMARRALQLGARQLLEREHRAMQSPAGMRFCLVADRGESQLPPPPDVELPHRIDHVSIDIPADRFEAEVHFWEELTGWKLRQSSYPEFMVFDPPGHLPFGMLLQSLGKDDARSEATAHLDIAAGARVAELVARHEQLGASTLATFEHWTVLADPAGQPYCITASDPVR